MKQNAIRVEKVISVGPVRETKTVADAIAANSRFSGVKVEQILTVRPPSSDKLSREEILEKLMPHIKDADARTMVITDIGDVRLYKGEQMAADVAAHSNGAAFCLLTSKPECVGSPLEFAKLIKSRGFSPSEIMPLINYIVHYAGNSDAIPAFLSIHEDKLNYKYGSERSILVVEDKPNYYSGFLTQLYDISAQRTRLLLARTFEEAEEIIHTAKERFAGAIIGLRFPRNGVLSETAPYEVSGILHAYNKGVPIVYQSMSDRRLERAKQDPGVFTLSKRDPILMIALRNIMQDYFGFGDFIFRDASGKEVGRAGNFKEFYSALKTLDGKSLVAHASRDDFSNWLYVHGYDDAASAIKPVFTDNAELLRRILLQDLAPFADRFPF
ncbi:MAG: hypothetical protein WCT52_02825 [Candidatus Micrarchaeia archaeon]